MDSRPTELIVNMIDSMQARFDQKLDTIYEAVEKRDDKLTARIATDSEKTENRFVKIEVLQAVHKTQLRFIGGISAMTFSAVLAYVVKKIFGG